jgi:6,7-dimethyl-8-ribityllumazine synthase
MDLTVQRRLAIGYGILTVETEAQAWARARRAEGDKGADAAHAALRMMSLRQIYRAPP